MDKVIQNIASPEWWIGVVIVGVIVSLIAAYLKPLMDSFLKGVSARWKRYSENKETEWLKEVEALKNSHELRVMKSFQEMRCRIRATQNFIFAVMFVVFSTVAFEGKEESANRILVNVMFLATVTAALIEHRSAIKAKKKIFASLRTDDKNFNN